MCSSDLGISNQAGSLEAGREANFILFDTEATHTVTADKLHSRHLISPYLGETLRGVVKATYLRGEPIYRAGTFAVAPTGRELALC